MTERQIVQVDLHGTRTDMRLPSPTLINVGIHKVSKLNWVDYGAWTDMRCSACCTASLFRKQTLKTKSFVCPLYPAAPRTHNCDRP